MKKVTISKAIKGVSAAASAIYYGGADMLVAHASGVDSTIDWLTDAANASSSALNGLTNTVKTEGAGAYQLILVIGIIGLLISIVVLGLSFAIGKNANKRDDNKTQLVYIAVGGIILFGAGALVGGLKTIGSGISF